jgi:hypothetical protein
VSPPIKAGDRAGLARESHRTDSLVFDRFRPSTVSFSRAL